MAQWAVCMHTYKGYEHKEKTGMKKKQIDFYYYSGTGNTLLVTKEMVRIFEKNAITVQQGFHTLPRSEGKGPDQEAAANRLCQQVLSQL